MIKLTVIFMLFATAAFGQKCDERGHVGGVGTRTLRYCPPRLEDSDSMSIMVYPSCNSSTYKCERCGETVTEQEK